MTPIRIIAAGDFEDVLRVIGLVIFLVIAAIVALIKKAAEKQQQRAMEARRREAALRRQAQVGQPPQAGTPRAATAQRRAGAVGAPVGRAPGGTAGRRPGLGVPPRPPSRPQPTFAETGATGVQEEVLEQQERLRREELQRRRRLAARVPDEADTARIQARLGRIRPAQIAAGPAQPAVPLTGLAASLRQTDSARQAIIFHEILSPPKGLRHQPEIWEL